MQCIGADKAKDVWRGVQNGAAQAWRDQAMLAVVGPEGKANEGVGTGGGLLSSSLHFVRECRWVRFWTANDGAPEKTGGVESTRVSLRTVIEKRAQGMLTVRREA